MPSESVFLEHAIDGAHGRIEILEDRARSLRNAVFAMVVSLESLEPTSLALYQRCWLEGARQVLASMPEDPTLTE